MNKATHKNRKVSYNGQTGAWTVKAPDGKLLCHGDQRKVEDYLDGEDAAEYAKRQRRIKRRMCKLLNWLYNHKKRR